MSMMRIVKDVQNHVENVLKNVKKQTSILVHTFQGVAEESKEILKETKTATEKGIQRAEELASPKASVRLVSIPEGTTSPGCEEKPSDNL